MLLFDQEALDFVKAHLDADVPDLLLRGRFTESEKRLLEQVFRRQKAVKKLPTCAAESRFYWPPPVHIEQSSSEKTALFKASLVSGNRLIDLSAGMGIDALYMSKQVKQIDLVEPNETLSEISAYNLTAVFGIQHAVFHAGKTAETFLAQETGSADWIYVDPSRRNDQGKKVFRLADCLPNVVELETAFFRVAPRILIKLSPMADVKQVIRELQHVSTVYAIYADGECKELLLCLEKESVTLRYIAVDIDRDIILEQTQEEASLIPYTLPQTYLYEPNAACHKLGIYSAIAEKYKLNKLHQDSHLFTSNKLISNFPGRVFEITSVVKLDRKQLQTLIPEGKANISVRNFPMTVAEIRAKTKLADGGSVYLMATTLIDQRKVLLLCRKLES